jgi:hypothetical protein
MASYVVVPTDFTAMPAFLAAQNDMRQMLAVAPAATITDFINQVDALGFASYPTGASQIQTWVTEFFGLLANTATTTLTFMTPTPVTAVYVARCFAAWWQVHQSWGWSAIYFIPGSMSYGYWSPPSYPPVWSQSIGSVLSTLAKGAEIDNLSGTLTEFPGAWTDYVKVPSACTLWSEQSTALGSMLHLSGLTADQCPFLFYLLLALTTSTASDQAEVQKISNTACNSSENPNSTLAQQLVYFTLMYMNNPMGMDWTHDHILACIKALIAAIPVNSGSATLTQVLTQQEKLLIASANYPMVDPYNPAIGFNQRYSDTLAAINLAWPGANS